MFYNDQTNDDEDDKEAQNTIDEGAQIFPKENSEEEKSEQEHAASSIKVLLVHKIFQQIISSFYFS